jgi:hypothetical protein
MRIKYIIAFVAIFFFGIYAKAQITKADSLNLHKWLTRILYSVNKKEQGTFAYSNLAFNAADLYAMENHRDSTFYYLNEAINTCPYTDPKCAETYLPDVLGTCFFEKWHYTKEWKDFDAKLTQGFYKTNSNIKNPKLAFDLLRAKGADQTIRYYFYIIKSDSAAKKDWKRIDSSNLVFIRNVVDKYGFPGLSIVGKEASNAAFLLCQHADNDINFQKQILADMEKLMKGKDVRPEDYAYLTDRIMVQEKGTQLYGTQFKNKNALYPIIDSVNVDVRRKKMGLSTLSEYKKSIEFFGN